MYFTEALSQSLFQHICNSIAVKYFKAFKEINISFTPYEAQVYTLNYDDAFQLYYNPQRAVDRNAGIAKMAEQIATLCSTLGEYPLIRYRACNEKNMEIAALVQQKLEAYREYEGRGGGADNSKSQLIILDRGFDVTTPLLHELTYQVC